MAVQDGPMHEPDFGVAMLGYAKREVDAFVAQAHRERLALGRLLDKTRSQADRAEAEARRTLKDTDRLRNGTQVAGAVPEHLGERLTQILRLAEEEAEQRRAEADAEVERARSEAAAETEEILSTSRHRAEVMTAAAREESDQLLAASRGQADRLLLRATEDSDRLRADSQEEAARRLAEARQEAEQKLWSARELADRILRDARDRAARLDEEVADRVEELARTHTRLITGLGGMRDSLIDMLDRDVELGAVEPLLRGSLPELQESMVHEGTVERPAEQQAQPEPMASLPPAPSSRTTEPMAGTVPAPQRPVDERGSVAAQAPEHVAEPTAQPMRNDGPQKRYVA